MTHSNIRIRHGTMQATRTHIQMYITNYSINYSIKHQEHDKAVHAIRNLQYFWYSTLTKFSSRIRRVGIIWKTLLSLCITFVQSIFIPYTDCITLRITIYRNHNFGIAQTNSINKSHNTYTMKHMLAKACRQLTVQLPADCSHTACDDGKSRISPSIYRYRTCCGIIIKHVETNLDKSRDKSRHML